MFNGDDTRIARLLGPPPIPHFARTPQEVAEEAEQKKGLGLRALAGGEKRGHDNKGVADFLSPRMPGRFAASEIRKKPPEWRRARYLKAYAASMGNHSLARFFCAWSPAEFREQIAQCPEFVQDIADAAEEIADRAKYVLYVDLGLIEGEVEQKARSSVSAVLSRLVEDLHARSEQPTPKGPYKRPPPRRVQVQGLTRRGDNSSV